MRITRQTKKAASVPCRGTPAANGVSLTLWRQHRTGEENTKGSGEGSSYKASREGQCGAPSHFLLFVLWGFLENSSRFDAPCSMNGRTLQTPGLNDREAFEGSICTCCCRHPQQSRVHCLKHQLFLPVHIQTALGRSMGTLLGDGTAGQWVPCWVMGLGCSENTARWGFWEGRFQGKEQRHHRNESEKEKTKFHLHQKLVQS